MKNPCLSCPLLQEDKFCNPMCRECDKRVEYVSKLEGRICNCCGGGYGNGGYRISLCGTPTPKEDPQWAIDARNYIRTMCAESGVPEYKILNAVNKRPEVVVVRARLIKDLCEKLNDKQVAEVLCLKHNTVKQRRGEFARGERRKHQAK